MVKQINGFCASKNTVLKRCNALSWKDELRRLEASYHTHRIAICHSHTPVMPPIDPNPLEKSQDDVLDNFQNEEKSILDEKLRILLENNVQAVLTLCDKIEKENNKRDVEEESRREIWVQDPSKFDLENEMENLRLEFDTKMEKLKINFKIYSSEMYKNCENEKILSEKKIRNSGKEFQVSNSPLNRYLREKNLDFTELDEFSVSEVILQEKNSLQVMCERILDDDFRIFCDEETEISLIVSLTPAWGVHSDTRESHHLLHMKIIDRIHHNQGPFTPSYFLSSFLPSFLPAVCPSFFILTYCIPLLSSFPLSFPTDSSPIFSPFFLSTVFPFLSTDCFPISLFLLIDPFPFLPYLPIYLPVYCAD